MQYSCWTIASYEEAKQVREIAQITACDKTFGILIDTEGREPPDWLKNIPKKEVYAEFERVGIRKTDVIALGAGGTPEWPVQTDIQKGEAPTQIDQTSLRITIPKSYLTGAIYDHAKTSGGSHGGMDAGRSKSGIAGGTKCVDRYTCSAT